VKTEGRIKADGSVSEMQIPGIVGRKRGGPPSSKTIWRKRTKALTAKNWD